MTAARSVYPIGLNLAPEIFYQNDALPLTMHTERNFVQDTQPHSKHTHFMTVQH